MQVGLSSPLKTIIPTIPAEYIIYAYHSFDCANVGQNHWSRLTSGHDQEEVLQKAEKLYRTRQYQKIEVQKKTFSDKKGKYIASTYRIFAEKRKNNYLTLATVLLLAFASAGSFYLKYM